MNTEEDTLDTNTSFEVAVRKAPIKYVGPKDEAPKYVEFGEKEKRERSEAQREALRNARLGKKRGPYKKGEQK